MKSIKKLLINNADSLALYINQTRRKSYYYNNAKKDSIFEAASLTKVVFAVLCLKLVKEGLLDLDKPLVEYKVNYRKCSDERFNQVTSRMILSHSAGFVNWSNKDNDWELHFNPGTKMMYSGEGYLYLQKIIEKLLNDDITDIIKEKVFIPLKMNSSYMSFCDAVSRNLIDSYDDNLSICEDYKEIKKPNVAYSLYTTLDDYQKLIDFILCDFDEDLKHLMSNVKIKITKNYGWALGIGNISNQYGFQWGDNGNFKNFVFIDFKNKKSILGFTNSYKGLNVLIPVINKYYPCECKMICDFLKDEYSNEGYFIHQYKE